MALKRAEDFHHGLAFVSTKVGFKIGFNTPTRPKSPRTRAAAEPRINSVRRDPAFRNQQVAGSILAGGSMPSNPVYPVNAWAKRKAHWCWEAASDISSWRNSTCRCGNPRRRAWNGML
jgi:hypothetical protein